MENATKRYRALNPIKKGDALVLITRPWKERLFSWPWRPWEARGVRRQAPLSKIKLDTPQEGTIYCHLGSSPVNLISSDEPPSK